MVLEIIATTYHSMIFKTNVFGLYSHLCINLSFSLPIWTWYIQTGSRWCIGATQGPPEDDD